MFTYLDFELQALSDVVVSNPPTARNIHWCRSVVPTQTASWQAISLHHDMNSTVAFHLARCMYMPV